MDNDDGQMDSLKFGGCDELDGPCNRPAWPSKNNMGCLAEEIRVIGWGYGTWNPSGSCWWWWWWWWC